MTRAERAGQPDDPTDALAADSRERAVGALLRVPTLRKLWTAQFTGAVGDRLGVLALLALAVQAEAVQQALGGGYRGVGFAIAIVFGLRLLAGLLFGAVLLGPLAALTSPQGVLDRRWTMIGADAVRLALFVVAPLWIDWVPATALSWLLVTVFVTGVAERVWTIAKDGASPALLPAQTGDGVRPGPDHLAALRRLDLRTGFVALPIAAAVLVLAALVNNVLGVWSAWFDIHHVALASYVAAGLFAASVALLFFLELPDVVTPRPRSPLEGLRRPKGPVGAERGRTKALPMLVFACAAVSGAVAAAVSVAVLQAADLGGGPVGFGLLVLALAGGTVLGIRAAPRLLPALSRRRLMALAVAVTGVSLLATGLVPDPATVLMLSLLAGCAAGVAANTGHTLIDQEAEEVRRARTTAHLHAVVRVATALAAVGAPVVAAVIGRHRVVDGAFTFDARRRRVHPDAGRRAAAAGRRPGARPARRPAGRTARPRPARGAARRRAGVRPGARRFLPGRRGRRRRRQDHPGRGARRVDPGQGPRGRRHPRTGRHRGRQAAARDPARRLQLRPVAPRRGAAVRGRPRRTRRHRGAARRWSAERSSSPTATSTPPSPTRAPDATWPPTEIARISRWATDGLVPHLTVLLDIPPHTARERFTEAPDRLESEPAEFHERVRRGFLTLAAADPARYLVLDAGQDPEALTRLARHRLDRMLPLSEQEIAARAEAERLAAEEARRRAEQEAAARAEEERQERERQEQIARLRAEEEERERLDAERRRQEEAEAQAEEARRRAEEQARLAEEERLRREADEHERAERERARREAEEREHVEEQARLRRQKEEQDRLRAEAAARRLEKQRRAEEALLRAEGGRPPAEPSGSEGPSGAAGSAGSAGEAGDARDAGREPSDAVPDGPRRADFVKRTGPAAGDGAEETTRPGPSGQDGQDAGSGPADGDDPARTVGTARPDEPFGPSGAAGSTGPEGSSGGGPSDAYTRTLENVLPGAAPRPASPDGLGQETRTVEVPRIADPEETTVLPRVDDPERTTVLPRVDPHGEPAPRDAAPSDRRPSWAAGEADGPGGQPSAERTRELPQVPAEGERTAERKRPRPSWAEETPLDDLPSLADELLGPHESFDHDGDEAPGSRDGGPGRDGGGRRGGRR